AKYTQTKVLSIKLECGLVIVELHSSHELRRPDDRVDLCRVYALVAQERAHLLEVELLLEDFPRHSVPQVVRLQLRHADQPPVRLAEPPDVLAVDRHHAAHAILRRPS